MYKSAAKGKKSQLRRLETAQRILDNRLATAKSAAERAVTPAIRDNWNHISANVCAEANTVAERILKLQPYR